MSWFRRKPHEHVFDQEWVGCVFYDGQIVSCIEGCLCGEERTWSLTGEQFTDLQRHAETRARRVGI